jgi:glycerophosphoryl diester phosphodiesterase
MRLPKVIGHRGAAALAPENTLAGLRLAAELGARCVEFDTKLTADGRCIVFHDETLERTTDGRGRVAATRYDDIAGLDAGAWFDARFTGERVPSLDAALDTLFALDLAADIEIKACPGRESETGRAVGAALVARWPADRAAPLITSFSPESLMAARAAAPGFPIGLLSRTLPGDWRARLEALDCRVFVCLHRRLTRRTVAALGDAGVTIVAFTVNEPWRAVELLDWGVASIVSDDPAAVLAAARAHGHGDADDESDLATGHGK